MMEDIHPSGHGGPSDRRAALTGLQWQELTRQFSIQPCAASNDVIYAVRASELLDRSGCGAYLDWLGESIGSPSRQVTASTLIKRYARCAAASVLYAMSVYNRGLWLEAEQAVIETPGSTRPAVIQLPRLSLAVWQVTVPADSAEARRRWRDSLVQHLFSTHLSPLLEMLSTTARLPISVLWENTAVRILPMFERAYAAAVQSGEPETAARIREDSQAVVFNSPGRWFNAGHNPLGRFARAESGLHEELTIMPVRRRTCCLYYKVAAEYCQACPITENRQ